MVLVGHSHFFREIFRKQLRADFAASSPELADGLRTEKLQNCGVACVDLDFGGAADAPVITNVRLMLGTKLVS